MHIPFSLKARTVRGAGRGKGLGTPTINLELEDIPASLQEGIYACIVTLEERRVQAAMHYGPRPVFKDTTSCEVHLLDTKIENAPESLEVEIVAYLREVRDFPSVEDLRKQIDEDIVKTRAILDDHESI